MNKHPNDEFPEQESELNPSDFMLMMLLKDFLEEEEPPDLKSRLLVRLAKGESGDGLTVPNAISRARFTNEEYDAAMLASSKDIENGYGTTIPAPLETTDALSCSTDGNLVWIRRGMYIALALAATVLGVIFAPSALKSWKTNPSNSEIAKTSVAPVTDLPDVSVVAIDQSNKEPNVEKLGIDSIDEQGKAPVNGLLESIAKRLDKPMGHNLEPVLSNVPAASVAGQAMRNEEIVDVMDNQMSYLWNRVGLVAAPSVQIDIWLDRAAIAILGRQATTAEKEAFRSGKSENRVSHYVDSLLSGAEFSRYWSTKLAEHYLGKRLLPKRDLSIAEYAFVEWLEESLSENVFIGEIERQMISGPTAELSVASRVRTDPASFWLSETMDRATANHLDSLDQLVPAVKRRPPREESLIDVSRQLMRLSGNPSMVCSQCHIDETGSADLRGYISMSRTQLATGSKSFWSVPANLSGMTLIHQTSGNAIRSEPPTEFFYEDAEGRMKLAVAGPPSLRKIENGNKPLGEWFSSSEEPRRAVVDMVWGQIFKQPLVPTMGLSEDEGLNERVDLRELLASQMQHRKADLGSLVRWIVFSKSFQLEGLKTDGPWYLKSTEQQIAESQRKLRMFAEFPAVASPFAESSKLSPGKVASWINQKRAFQNASDAALAQGATSKPQGKGPKALKLDYSEDQVRFLVSVEEPYSQLKAISERWAKSSMSWQMLLEHAYLATDARFPTRLERDEANNLLESSGKDRAKTLVMIVTARLGSW